jgi:hypothetical protein
MFKKLIREADFSMQINGIHCSIFSMHDNKLRRPQQMLASFENQNYVNRYRTVSWEGTYLPREESFSRIARQEFPSFFIGGCQSPEKISNILKGMLGF